MIDRARKHPIKVEITFNNQEWIPAVDFTYHDHLLTRVAYAHAFMAPTSPDDAEQRENDWQAELPEEEYPEEMSEEERKKKEEEKVVIATQETEESQNVSKRKGWKIFIHGENFRKTNEMAALFSWNDQVQVKSPLIFKNPKLFATTIPDMGGEVPEGDHLLSVTITLNGQQYNQHPVQFLYKSVDPNLTEEELKKMDEDDAKAKKPGGKKK